jgi:hypothetical protein
MDSIRHNLFTTIDVDSNGTQYLSLVTSRHVYLAEELCIAYGATFWQSKKWSIDTLKPAEHYYGLQDSTVWTKLSHEMRQDGLPRAGTRTSDPRLLANKNTECSQSALLPLNAWMKGDQNVFRTRIMSNLNLAVATLNVNELFTTTDRSHVEQLVKWLSDNCMDCTYLLDIRLTEEGNKSLSRQIKTLWPGA